MVAASFAQLVNCIGNEADSSFLASLFKCFFDTMLVLGGPSALAPEVSQGFVEAAQRQLQSLADKRKARAARPRQEIREEREDLMLIEEMEDFALEDLAKVLRTFDADHNLLFAVSSVRELGLNLSEWDGEDGSGETS